MSKDEVVNSLNTILKFIGEDPSREGLKDTPNRIIKSWDTLYGGYNKRVEDILTTFEEDGAVPVNQIVLLKDIELYSTCEHHMLPFTGRAHVAYIPDGKVVGISKLARIVDIFARRLQIQERLGNQVTDSLMEHLNAKAAACIIEAKHMCMTSRGVGKQHSVMVTSSLRGGFLTSKETRQELMSLIKMRH